MRWLLLLILFLTAAFTPVDREKQRSRQVNEAIELAGAYLHAEYARGAFGLLPESPKARPNKHWLATDNQLAVYALRAAGSETFAAQLEQARQAWNALPHGLIEALAGEPIAWPPHQEHQYEVVTGNSPPTVQQPNVCSKPENSPVNVVCQEIRDEPLPVFQDDWQDYADLGLYGALEACNRGNGAQAHDYYRHAMILFKGVGFDDRANEGNESKLYATYKVALALYVGAKLDKPTNNKRLAALLAKQDKKTGGFVTLYDSEGVGQGDSNTETTAYALLALATVQKEHSPVRDSVCPRN